MGELFVIMCGVGSGGAGLGLRFWELAALFAEGVFDGEVDVRWGGCFITIDEGAQEISRGWLQEWGGTVAGDED
jgi:hypothetical protein